MSRVSQVAVMVAALSLMTISAGNALAGDDGADALRARVAELEKRIAEMEKLLKEHPGAPAPGAQPVPGAEMPQGPMAADEMPEWARKRLQELLDRGIQGEFRIPGLGDMRVETLPRARRAYLGIHIEPLPADAAAQAKLEQAVRVARVEPGSPAAESGIREGDILLKINGEVMETPDEVVETIGSARAGDRVKLTVLRDGVEFTATAKLASGGGRVPNQMPWGARPFEEERDPFEMLRRFRFRMDPEMHLGDAAPPEANVETKIDTPDGRVHASVQAPTLTMPDATAKAIGVDGEALEKARELLAAARAELAKELNSAAGKAVGGGQASIDFSAVNKKLSKLEASTAKDLAKVLTPEQMEKYEEWRAARRGFSHTLRIERGVRPGGGAAQPQIRGMEVF